MEDQEALRSHKNSLDTDAHFDDFATFKADSPIPNEILLIITIDLGNGLKDNIEIKRNDDPEDLALQFIAKNGLDEKILGVLTQNIRKNMSTLQKNEGLASKIEEKTEGVSFRDQNQYEEIEENPENNATNFKASGVVGEQSRKSSVGGFNEKRRYLLEENEDHSFFLNTSNYDLYTFTPKLDPQSIELAKKKIKNPSLNVYQRLFNQARKVERKKANNSFDASKVQNKENKSGKSYGFLGNMKKSQRAQNYGEKLYERCVKQKDLQSRAMEMKRLEEIRESEKSLTFKPYINEISTLIQKRYKRQEKVEEYLTKMGKLMKLRKEKQLEIRNSFELRDCSFHPQINKISEIIDCEKKRLGKSHSNDRFSRLYETSFEYQAKREKKRQSLENQFAHKPSLNKNSLNMIENHDFFARMEQFSSVKNEKLKQKKDDSVDLFDSQTGAPFFRPKVGRAPLKKRNNENLPVGDYLYGQRREYEERKKALLEKSFSELEEKKRGIYNMKSGEIFKQKKLKKLKEIFLSFDSDQDGLISAAKIDISSVSTLILQTFAPLLEELEELNQELNLEEFVEAAERLLKTLSVQEKAEVLGLQNSRNAEKTTKKSFTFQPEINEKSLELAKKKREEIKEKSIYDFYIKEKEMWNEKKRNLQLLKANEEFRQCVFQPQIERETSYLQNSGEFHRKLNMDPC